jgi:4-hydroxyphenylpyruvate dioxygenase
VFDCQANNSPERNAIPVGARLAGDGVLKIAFASKLRSCKKGCDAFNKIVSTTGSRNMQRSIATVSLSGTLPEKLEAIAAAGFDGVEIFENDLLYYDGSPREIKQMCADLGIAITLFQPFRDFEGCRRDRLHRNLERAERKFDLMQELGTDLVLVCSNASADSIGDENILIDDLRLLAERAGARGLRIGYEALAWGRHVNTWQQVWNIVRQADHPSLGVLLDSFHTLSLKGDPSAIAEIPGDKIFFVQMADAPILAMDVLEWSRHFRCFPGQGEFDLPGFLAPIIKSGYTGPLSLEIFNDGFRAAPPRANAADGLRSLLYLEEKTRQRLAQETTPAVSLDILFETPKASEYNGIEFLEFAVDESLGAKLSHWLERLGFVKAGQHRSKSVSLLRQGDINLILNSEPYSFAHSFFEAHGPSLCATAVRVKDSASALARAVAYKGQPYRGLVGPNELELAAVRAPDGSLIYLVDQDADVYGTDFHLQPAAVAGGGLKRIDHMAMALPADSLDSWVLFYKSLLDFEADDEVVLPDPYGLVKSRALRSRDSSIRLPLNISENRNTAISHALSSYRGSGVHHIAFDCDDIFAEVSRAKEAGVPLLDIPLNYYDDLAARFDFDDEFLSELAYFNVLYDRDAQGGELFHVYTEPFEGRFFFEIIQRKNGYAGYGAANVAVRLAAMAKSRSGAVRLAKL